MTPLPLPKKKDLRADSAWVLYQILENGKSSRDCLTKIQRRHTHRDNGWIQEMTMGVLRQLPQLQLWLRTLLDKPLKGDKKVLEHLLLLGLYQLAFSRVSAHAAVGETVNAASILGGNSLKGLLNAILRNFQRQELAHQRSDDVIIQSGLPKWLYKKMAAAYTENIADVVAQTNQVAPIWLRVNTLRMSKADYTKALDDADIAYTCPDTHADGIVLSQRCDVTTLPGFAEGWFAVQDGAAQLAADYLAPEEGERILDCCAAPGGKTGHLLERQPDIAQCVALDNDATRLQRVRENMQRLGHNPVITEGDAANPANWWNGKAFDRILLDAPCSATGVIRRHPDIRWLRKSTDIAQLVALQSQILDALWPTLKPGGTLVYATCSVLPEENSEQIAAFIARHNDAQLVPICEGETTAKPGRQILPGDQQMDGFYYAKLVKSND